ncbi:MAG: DUF3810 domain-containing protein [Lachnospiraceae bacterium]|nr:DUF3810 domain-containing protein [Lachnospiraceae bacterium]
MGSKMSEDVRKKHETIGQGTNESGIEKQGTEKQGTEKQGTENNAVEKQEAEKYAKDKRLNGGKSSRGYWRILWVFLALTVVLNLLGCSKGFCDGYKLTVYGWISDGLGMVTGLFPFVLGEILGFAGALAVLVGMVFMVLLPFLRKRAGFRKFASGFGKGLLMGMVLILFVYTLNWILPFRGTILKVKGSTERGYTVLEVQNVRNYIVNQLNACAKEVLRDENGSVIYDRERMTQAVFTAMQAQSGDYPLLSGYYPPMKGASFSDFLEWMNIGGYTYPYTMEITWNIYCNDLYYPFLLAHESSHHQGYYQENEANFIAFLACTQSEDPLIRYAGYNEIYYYLNNAYAEALYSVMDRETVIATYKEQPQVSARVQKDRQEAREASRKRYEAVSHPAQKLETVSAQVADKGWSMQGDILQENSYDGVVKMVLQYFDVQEGGLGDAF